jgi:hypothetical protein
VDANASALSNVSALTCGTGSFTSTVTSAALVSGSLNVTSSVTAATGVFSGAVSVASLTSTGVVSGASVSASGVVSGASLSLSGAISAVTTITASGLVTANAGVAMAGVLTQSSTAPASAISSQAVAMTSGCVEAGSGVILEIINFRSAVGSGHGTVEQHIRRKVDVTVMGYIGWGSQYISLGMGNGAEIVRWSSNGRMKFSALISGSGTTYADDAAAGAGGLVSGEVYWTSAGDLKRKL